jgi:hypothetical protein
VSLVIRSSTLVRTDRAAIAVARSVPGVEPERDYAGRQVPPGVVLFPRFVQGLGTRMVRTPVEALPMGWQSIGVRVPMRLATCEEVDCPFFLSGWTEVLPGDGTSHPETGEVLQDQAAATWGAQTQVVQHPPGVPCGRIHKLPSGLPPLYHVNGRPTLWNEFEDSIGNGAHRAAQFRREGTA